MEIFLVIGVVLVFAIVLVLSRFGNAPSRPSAAPVASPEPALPAREPEPEVEATEPEPAPAAAIEPLPDPAKGDELSSQRPEVGVHSEIEHNPSAGRQPFDSPPAPKASAPSEADLAALRDRLALLEESRDRDDRLESLKKALGDLDSKLDSLESKELKDERVAPLEKRIEDLARRIDETPTPEGTAPPEDSAVLKDLASRLEGLESRLDRVEKQPKRPAREPKNDKADKAIADLEDRLARAEAAFMDSDKGAGREDLKEIFQRLSDLEAAAPRGEGGDLDEVKDLFNNLVRNLDAQAERMGER